MFSMLFSKFRVFFTWMFPFSITPSRTFFHSFQSFPLLRVSGHFFLHTVTIYVGKTLILSKHPDRKYGRPDGSCHGNSVLWNSAFSIFSPWWSNMILRGWKQEQVSRFWSIWPWDLHWSAAAGQQTCLPHVQQQMHTIATMLPQTRHESASLMQTAAASLMIIYIKMYLFTYFAPCYCDKTFKKLF